MASGSLSAARVGGWWTLVITAAAGLAPVPAAGGVVVVHYDDFSSPAGLSLVGDAAIEGSLLRVTSMEPFQTGAAWHRTRVPVAAGFDALFRFRLANRDDDSGGDGFAFVVQDADHAAIGQYGGYLGYGGIGEGGGGIPRSLAVEFDTYQNLEEFSVEDPNGNHVSVQSRGEFSNSASPAFSLGGATDVPPIEGGTAHRALVSYRPGSLRVFLDDLQQPVAVVPLDLAAWLGLNDGRAYVGFTAGTGGLTDNHDILSLTVTAVPLPKALWPALLTLPLAAGPAISRARRRGPE